ncbi:MAG: serine/threonine protein kinase, partial [Myxococcales bacterium]|nr:serine/threonine protein kinase [Myxococcales bacterium]
CGAFPDRVALPSSWGQASADQPRTGNANAPMSKAIHDATRVRARQVITAKRISAGRVMMLTGREGEGGSMYDSTADCAVKAAGSSPCNPVDEARKNRQEPERTCSGMYSGRYTLRVPVLVSCDGRQPAHSSLRTRTFAKSVDVPMSATRDPWDWLTDQLEAFLTAWEEHESSGPPAIATYAQAVLEAGDLNAEEAGDLQRTLLAELIKADIEYRLLHSVAPPLEDYLSAHASLRELPVDLLHEDYHLRRRAGEEVSVEDYCERFPGQAEDFRRLLGLDLPEATTTLYASKRPPLFQLGDLVADEFRLLAMLGEGSFARVYLARQESISRLVALKITANRGHEAQTIVKLDHPNIIRVVDQRDVPDENMRLLYMEYAPGGTLHEVVRRVQATEPRTGDLLAESVRESMERGGLEASFPATLREAAWPRIVCDLGIQLALALDYAHSQGVLHRDIKPANVLVMRALGITVKLIDFGMSKSLLDDNHLTEPGRVMGTPSYLAPEVLLGKPADVRADIYGIGATVYEALVGVPWVKNHSRIEQTLHAVLTKQPEPPSKLRPKVPDYVDALVLQACARDPNQRFSDAAEFKRAADDAMNRAVREEIDAP